MSNFKIITDNVFDGVDEITGAMARRREQKAKEAAARRSIENLRAELAFARRRKKEIALQEQLAHLKGMHPDQEQISTPTVPPPPQDYWIDEAAAARQDREEGMTFRDSYLRYSYGREEKPLHTPLSPIYGVTQPVNLQGRTHPIVLSDPMELVDYDFVRTGAEYTDRLENWKLSTNDQIATYSAPGQDPANGYWLLNISRIQHTPDRWNSFRHSSSRQILYSDLCYYAPSELEGCELADEVDEVWKQMMIEKIVGDKYPELLSFVVANRPKRKTDYDTREWVPTVANERRQGTPLKRTNSTSSTISTISARASGLVRRLSQKAKNVGASLSRSASTKSLNTTSSQK